MYSVISKIGNVLKPLAVLLLLMLPFVSQTPQASAMETHSQHMPQEETARDCATACARTIAVSPPATTVEEDKLRTPEPEPREPALPYHLQFQSQYALQVQRPNPLGGTSPARPPDIVKLSAHFLF